MIVTWGLIALCITLFVISLLKEKELRDYKQETKALLDNKEDEIFVIGSEYEHLKIKHEKLKKS